MNVATARFPAPAVQFPLRRSRALGALLAVLQLAALAVLCLWWAVDSPAQRQAHVLVLALWAVTVVVAWRWWLRMPVGTLSWDGRGWLLMHAGHAHAPQPLGVQVAIAIDLQRCVGLEFPLARPKVWLWAERASDPPRWIELRRAVYSPAKAVSVAQPEDASP